MSARHPDPLRGSGRFLPLLLGGLSLAVYLAINAGVLGRPFPATGDEPHYLLIARSLAQDFDIDLTDDYASTAARRFTPMPLGPHAITGPSGELTSFHFPALPLLLAPLYLLTESSSPGAALFVLRLPSALALAAAGAALLTLLLRIGRSRLAALAAWASFGFCLPVLAYGSRIYPGAPIALLSVLVGSTLFSPAPISGALAMWSGLALASFPWFGLKFAGPAAALGLVLALRLRRRPRRLLLLALPALISAALLLWFLRAHFGGFAPDAIYGSAMPAAEELPPTWHWKPRWLIPALAAFFFDQRIGLLLYAPVFLLAAPGLVLLWRRAPRLAAALGLVLLGVLVPHALKWIWGGSCPPGRPLLPVMWAFALLVAEYLDARPRRGLTLLGVSLLLGAVSIIQPKLFYGATHFLADQRGRLWAALSAPGIDLTELLPRLIGLEPDWGKLVLAAALICMATALLLRGRALLAAWLAPALLVLLGAALWYRGAGWGNPMAGRLELEHGSLALLENAEPAGRTLALRRGTVRLLITQDRPLEQLELRFIPLAGSARISGSLEQRAFHLDVAAEERGRLRLRATGAALRTGGEFHYRLRLWIDGTASRTRLVLQPRPTYTGPPRKRDP